MGEQSPVCVFALVVASWQRSTIHPDCLQQFLTTLAGEQQRSRLGQEKVANDYSTAQRAKVAFLSLSLMRLKSRILPRSLILQHFGIQYKKSHASASWSSCGSCTVGSASPSIHDRTRLHLLIISRLGDRVVHEAQALQVLELRDGL